MRSRRGWTIVPLALCGVLLATQARAAIYWVAPQGCSDSQPASSNSKSSPFCTPQHAAGVLVPGDEVIVRDGTYADEDGNGITLNIVKGGASGAPVSFRSENRWGAKLVGKAAEATYCVNTATARSHIVIQGFDISGCATGININNDNHFVEVIGNRIHDVGRFVSNSTHGHDGISFGGGSSDVLVDGNLFFTIGRLPGSLYPYNHDHGIYIRSVKMTITNNVFYDFTAGWAIHIYGPQLKQDISIVNNTFAEPNPERDGHIIITSNTDKVQVTNNVFHEPRNAIVRVTGSCASITNVVVDHNITTVGAVVSGENCGFQLANNMTSASIGLVDPAQHDYHLLNGSPAIDVGAASGPDHDYDGVVRPQGDGIDLGAFEHVVAPLDAGASDAGADAAASGGSGAVSGGGGATNAGGSSATGGSAPGSGGATASGGAGANDSDADGGCGCRAAPGASSHHALLLSLALLGLARRRRPPLLA
jgi:MYXO-CTERM domain-containing protein